MKKEVDLPIVEPIYRTFNFQAAGSAVIKSNPYIKNWFLNNVMILGCDRRFLHGHTSPFVHVIDAEYFNNPHLIQFEYPLKYLGSNVHSVIRNLLDDGFYVFFLGIDDYYMKGKSWYREKHFHHDGLITGYDSFKKSYKIYAYDKDWLLNKFEVSQKDFSKALKSSIEDNFKGHITGLKAKDTVIKLDPALICKNIKEYLNSNIEMYPTDKPGKVFGIVVHEFIAIYLDKLYSGEIPYERMDRRVFRMIWEHKKVMMERIKNVEDELSLGNNFSSVYSGIVKEAENMRMMYASYNHKKRDMLLVHIKEKLLYIHNKEKELFLQFVTVAENALKNDREVKK